MHEDGKYHTIFISNLPWKSGSTHDRSPPLPTLESHAAKAKSFFCFFFGGKKSPPCAKDVKMSGEQWKKGPLVG